MGGIFTLSGTFEMTSEILKLINSEQSLLLIQGIKMLSLKLMSCLEEMLLDVEIPSKRYNNLTKDE